MEEKFIPYEKMSYRERRREDAKHRHTWGGLNPRTRKAESGKVYKRGDKHKRTELNWYTKLR